MSETYTFRCLHVCEEWRLDMQAKEIILGMYSGGIRTSAVPFLWPKAIFRIEVIIKKLEYDSVRLHVQKPSGSTFFETQFPRKFVDVGFPAPIAVLMPNPLFDELGDYQFSFGMDCPLEVIDSVKVIL